MAETIQERTVAAGPAPTGILTPDGTPREGSRVEEAPDLLLEMYRWMIFGRAFDTRLFNLQRQGRLTTYAPYAGQEAVQVGCALALERQDWLLGTYRDGLACTMHGLPAEHVVLYFVGHPKTGMTPPDINVVPQQVSIAEQIPQAVGVAWGMKLRRAGTAVLTMFGDGATSEGAFHEGMNFAGVMHAPIVLLCQNNGWAISVPRSRQTAAETFAQKAVAYGIPGHLVDGNDVIAVYRAVSEALQRARAGEGPTLIEAQTYRIGPHTTSDDPTRYRTPDELADWQQARDPLVRLRAYLERQDLWNDAQQQALEEETRERVARIVTAALAEPAPTPDEIFAHIYETPTPALQAQRDELRMHQQDAEGRRDG